ncbi:MAG: zinc metalloprotease HtpX [Pseudomonadota bacterium]|jgi:heat shock protein HtpX|nr:zinc metalloprotease HtpX [Pseudomonadota bacterium]HPD20389.1 zinc metalloprotease HtpX [Deltaproteobacteria bacterium]HRS55223.1 zinc metalloprotease HtpX [Desulfomonilia bacterium]HRV34849.1 zinc metalloprotease HtpX [Desulfomonilia bacterium]
MNNLKTFLLMLVMTLILIGIGNILGGTQGMVIAFVLAAVMNFASYWFSDRIVLSMYRAKKIEEQDMPELYSTVRNLTQQASLPMPGLYLIDTPMPNAFATGRNPSHAAVAVTRGIVDLLDSRELSGVIAHELSHVKNRDILISTIAATFAGAVFILARMAQFAAIFGGGRGGRDSRGGVFSLLIVAIVAPLAAMIVRMAISRSREYQADASGAQISGDPLSLAGALRKLESGIQRSRAEVNPSTAHLFIVNPLKGGSILALFSTHPPMEERIRRLEHMARGPIS